MNRKLSEKELENLMEAYKVGGLLYRLATDDEKQQLSEYFSRFPTDESELDQNDADHKDLTSINRKVDDLHRLHFSEPKELSKNSIKDKFKYQILSKSKKL